MQPLLLEHRNGSVWLVVDSARPVSSPSELAALVAEVGMNVPVFGLGSSLPSQSSRGAGTARPFLQVAFNHDRRNMIALRLLLEWRGDFSPDLRHDAYVTAKIGHLVHTEQIKIFQVKVEPDITGQDLLEYISSRSVGDLVEFMTEDECAAMELAGLVVPVAGNAADAAAAVCYAVRGDLINAVVSTAMIIVPGFIQAGIVALRRGRVFQAARAARRAEELKRQELLEIFRRAGRQSVEGRHAQLQRLDQVGRQLPVGTLPARGAPVGQGNFSEVFLSSDGSMVIKQIKTRIGHPGREMEISRDEMIAIAQRTVEQHEHLRRAGYPVPKSWVPAGNPTVVVQQRAPGVPFDQLPPEVRTSATGAADGLKSAAKSDRRVAIDSGRSPSNNMAFDENGNVTAWYDPGIPLDSDATRAVSGRAWTSGAFGG